MVVLVLSWVGGQGEERLGGGKRWWTNPPFAVDPQNTS